jgi:hydrogenase maturation protease
MPDLREQLEQCFQGRVCLMGLGNPDYGDDGFGVRLAEALVTAHASGVIIAGTTPERVLGRIADEHYDQIIFLDAVEFGGAPGSVVFLEASEITAWFPQISTHKISLGTLAKWVEADGRTQAWLLGVQPASLKPGLDLSPTVQRTLQMLAEVLSETAAPSPAQSVRGHRPMAIS